MQIFRTFAASAALALAGSAAFAWGDMYMGDGTHQPSNMALRHAYNAPNHCPAGLQPVLVGGEICCGVPNAGPYVDRPGKVKRTVVHKPARHAPRAYAIEGEKGVVYR